jgi:hypothetical protein
MVLDAFGETTTDECGHCDNCRRAVHRQVLASEETTMKAGDAPVDVETSPAFRVGEAVSVPVYGWGEVRGIEDDRVEVAFPDGTTKKFKPEFLIPQAS